MRQWFFNLLMAAAIICNAPAHAETVTIVADRWCPYNCEPNSEHPGLMIEIAQRAFAKHNIEVEYTVMPWTRAIEETRQHKYTAIVGAAHKDAPDFVFPKVPQGWMRNGFYVQKDSAWHFSGIPSLQQISLGVIADYSYNDELDAYVAKYKENPKYVQILSGEDALEMNVKKLLAGRIGALIEGEYVMDYYLAQHEGAVQLQQAGSLPPSQNDNLFIAFSPKEPKAKAYAEILSKETQALRASGELQKILTVYNVNDWQK